VANSLRLRSRTKKLCSNISRLCEVVYRALTGHTGVSEKSVEPVHNLTIVQLKNSPRAPENSCECSNGKLSQWRGSPHVAVDEIVAVKAPGSCVFQHRSISAVQLVQSKPVASYRFQKDSMKPRIRLGRRGSEVQILSPRPNAKLSVPET